MTRTWQGTQEEEQVGAGIRREGVDDEVFFGYTDLGEAFESLKRCQRGVQATLEIK